MVAVYQGIIDQSATVIQTSSFPQNKTLAIYFKWNNTYCKFLYEIPNNTQFQIVSVLKSTQIADSILSPTNNTTNTSLPSNRINSNYSNLPCSGADSSCLSLSTIDISKNYQNDLYFPKIALLMQTMYGSKLVNCKINTVNYTLNGTNNKLNYIQYNFDYKALNSTIYSFQV